MEDLTHDETFLQGWIGERLAALWLEIKGYKVECRVPQARGSEKSKSSGDIDFIASKDGETIYAEVKCWSEKSRLNPSWLVQYMLDRKKLNTLFERHDKATKHMLIFRYPAPGNFRYSNAKKYIETLINKYGVQKDFLEKLSGQSKAKFVEETLKHLIRKEVNKALDVQVIYFKQIIKELHDLNCLNEIKSLLKTELEGHFDYSFLDIEHT